jgi:hypothetical protein
MRTLTSCSSPPALRLAVVAAAVIACVACSGGGGRRIGLPAPAAPPAADASPLEGQWTLRSMELANGSTRRVSGSLSFDRNSTLSLRAEVTPDDPSARPPRTVVADFTARAAAADGQFSFAGLSMRVGAERLTEDAVPMDQWRHYELAGSTLRVSVRDGAGRRAATLVFERAQ